MSLYRQATVGKTQTGTFAPARSSRHLGELLEKDWLLGDRDPRPIIAHTQEQVAVLPPCPQADVTAIRGKLESVVDQVV